MKIKTNKKISRNLKSKTSGNYMHLGLLTWGNWKWTDQPNGEKKKQKHVGEIHENKTSK